MQEAAKWIEPEAFSIPELKNGGVIKDWRHHKYSQKMWHQDVFNSDFGYVQKDVLNEFFTDEEINYINSVFDEYNNGLSEKKMFEKANKITWPEYQGDGFFYCDEVYFDLESMVDSIACDTPEEEMLEALPEYVWAARDEPYIELNTAQIIENATDDMSEVDYDVYGYEELDEAIKVFNEKNKKQRVYYEDNKTAIVFSKQFWQNYIKE